jgi:CheY-like chemotaxis protein
MLAYARKARLTPVLTDLNQVVRETEKWLRRTIESRIEIETVLQAGLWPTMVDRVSLQSALVNLLVNARDAVDGSGQVTVETSNIRIEKEYTEDRNEDIPPGRYVMLAVTDTGTGIAPEFIDRIFDPFYTTKQIGKGSGLGLSMVQGFVKQSGGAIRVYSELDVGTSFKIYFPAAQVASQVSTEEDDVDFPSAVQERSGKRILLVEDQEGVLTVLEKTLRGAGFDVVTAESGDEAFRIFCDDNQFDLVATDIVMPGELQGPSLAREIRSLRPDIRFIFLSGYASEATVHGNGLRPEDIRLMKPVSRINLLDAVRSALSDQQDN